MFIEIESTMLSIWRAQYARVSFTDKKYHCIEKFLRALCNMKLMLHCTINKYMYIGSWREELRHVGHTMCCPLISHFEYMPSWPSVL